MESMQELALGTEERQLEATLCAVSPVGHQSRGKTVVVGHGPEGRHQQLPVRTHYLHFQS